MSVVRVVLADDEAMVRAGLRLLIDGEPDLEVVGEAVDGEDAVRVVRAESPDVVLMDVRMPRLNGLDAAQQLLRDDDPPRVLVLTTFDEDDVVDAALRHGIAGFLLKSSPPEDLLAAIRRAAEGRGVIDPSVVPGVIARLSRAPTRAARPAGPARTPCSGSARTSGSSSQPTPPRLSCAPCRRLWAETRAPSSTCPPTGPSSSSTP